MGAVKGTKTGRGRRVPCIGPLQSDLAAWRLESGSRTIVFPNFRGEHWGPADWHVWSGRALRPALVAAGIPDHVRPYDCRHSHASMLIASRMNVIEVARRLGHSPTMCLDTYAHVFVQWEGKRIDIEAEVRSARLGAGAGARLVSGLDAGSAS